MNREYIECLKNEIKNLTFNLAMCEYYYNADGTGSYKKNLLIEQINGMKKYLNALVKIYQDEKNKFKCMEGYLANESNEKI